MPTQQCGEGQRVNQPVKSDLLGSNRKLYSRSPKILLLLCPVMTFYRRRLRRRSNWCVWLTPTAWQLPDSWHRDSRWPSSKVELVSPTTVFRFHWCQHQLHHSHTTTFTFYLTCQFLYSFVFRLPLSVLYACFCVLFCIWTHVVWFKINEWINHR